MTVYPAIYCRKHFDVINYVIYCFMTCGFMRLATLQFELKLLKFIRIQNFHLGVYHLIYVRKSRFMSPLARLCKTKFMTVYLTNMKFEYSYPLSGLSFFCMALCHSQT